MADVAVLSVEISDADNKKKRMLIHVPVATTIAQAQAFSNALLPTVNGISQGVVSAVEITHSLTVDHGALGIRAAALAGSVARNGANFLFDVTGNIYNHGVRVPTITPTLVSADDTLDVLNAPVSTFTDFIEAGDGTVFPTDRAGLDIATVLSGKRSFHK
jgi:hypothetical protein